MPTSKRPLSGKRVERELSRKLLGKRDPEDAARCDLHRYILDRVERFQAPKSARGWTRKASKLRERYLREVYLKGHPDGLLAEKPKVRWGDTIETGRGYCIRKLRYEGFPGMWIPALLYEPDGVKGKVAAVLNPNGHHSGGKAMDYKQARCINLAKRGMLALNTEFIGMGELQMNREHNRIAHLDLCGVAGVAVFYLAMKRSLDVLLSHPHCDRDRVAMTGLSGGGWQTVVLSALDERVRVVVPVAGHSPVWQRVSCHEDIGDLEQVPVDLCTVADFDTMTALLAPRPTQLIYNLRDDCCFRSRRTRKSIYNPVRPLFEALGVGNRFRFYENRDPGTHNYEADNRSQLYRFLNEQWGLGTPENDLPYQDELRSETELSVGLPEDNETLLSLAARHASKARGSGGGRRESGETLRRARERLGKVIHLGKMQVRDEVVRRDAQTVQHRIHLNEAWNVPVTEFRGSGETRLLISDGGRVGVQDTAWSFCGARVLAADVFGTGENRFPAGLQTMLSAIGERPLGMLTGQILALTRWAAGRSCRPVHLMAFGPVVSFGALCASALEPRLFADLHLDGLMDSLKRLIDLPMTYEQAVPLFCFGLLKEFDVPDLVAMTEGVPIVVPNRGPVKQRRG